MAMEEVFGAFQIWVHVREIKPCKRMRDAWPIDVERK
jgi:hypothetical protein